MPLAQTETHWLDIIIEKLMSYGVMGILFAVFVWLLWRYGPKLFEAGINFIKETAHETNTKLKSIATNTATQSGLVKQLTDTSVKQTDFLERQTETLDQLCKMHASHTDPKGAPVYEGHIFSTANTNKALRLLCQAKLLETTNEPARQLIDEAIRVLTPK